MWGEVPGPSLVAPSSLGPRGIAKAQASGERKSGHLTTGGRGCGARLGDPKPQVSEERSLPRSGWIFLTDDSSRNLAVPGGRNYSARRGRAVPTLHQAHFLGSPGQGEPM